MAAQEKPLQIDFGSDEQEIHRLTIQHEVTKSAYPSLILAPIDLTQPGLKILDSATADGLWLRDIQSLVATPHSLIGTDINPNVFPSAPTQNITFQVQDITKPWPADLAGEFSLVHSRNGLAGCGAFPVEEAVKNLVGLVKPGGWIQIEEMDFQKVKHLPGAIRELADLLDVMFAAVGAHWGYADEMEKWLKDAGLVDVEVRVIGVPYGKACQDDSMRGKGVDAFVLGAEAVCIGAKALAVEGFTKEQLDTLPERLRNYLVEEGAEGPMVCVWGRKPL
ncbi:S-adenosyl-L-methionine-dependent methyltransferase [Rhexocercosporidium sp. MPI-PUGE-AT-0058]|nr:S-adenosyl-L-methionine-dependent methyltransferase [Rhexocercosporidium sp. MPI-PUGE-AT-0058]